MSLRSLMERRATIQDPNTPLTAENLVTFLGIGDSGFSPVNVTPESSLRISAVHACIRLLSDSVAMLPIDGFRHTGPKTREPADDHPYVRLIAKKPNPWQTRPEFWRQVMAWKLMRGNDYIYQTFNGRGEVTGLFNLPANRTSLRRLPGQTQPYYFTTLEPFTSTLDALPDELLTDPGRVRVFLPREIIHIRDFGTSLVGQSRVELARTMIGSTLAAEETGARLYANDARPGGVLRVPKTMSPAAYERLRLNWNSLHQGVKNAGTIALLEDGAEFQNVQLNPADAQFLESRKFGVVEIARLFGVPPHLVGDVERSTSWGTGIESQTLGYLQFTLMPHLVDLEAKWDLELLEMADPNLFGKFNVDAMKRVDTLTRAQALDIERRNGVINRDDWAELEDREPIGGSEGTDYWMPTNMMVQGQPPPAPSLDGAVRALVADAVQLHLTNANGDRDGA